MNSTKSIFRISLISYILFFISATSNATLEKIWQKIVSNLCAIIGVEFDIISYTGSGDTYFHFYSLPVFLILALIVSLVIFYTKSIDLNQEQFKFITITIVRFYLAYMMISYGLIKVFSIQFPDLSFDRLNTNLSDLSPMQLLWSFMSYSKEYTFAIGLFELVSGLCLLFRKTTLLGGVLAFGIMLNVFLLNLFYGVPAKILSFHLVVFSLIILIFNINQLRKIFDFNYTVPSFSMGEKIFNKGMSPRYDIISQIIIASVILIIPVSSLIKSNAEINFSYTPSGIKDVYDVEYMSVYQNEIQKDPLWKTIEFQSDSTLMVININNQIENYEIISSSASDGIMCISNKESTEIDTLKYMKVNPDLFFLTLENIHNDSIVMRFQRDDPISNSNLMFAKFRWVSDW